MVIPTGQPQPEGPRRVTPEQIAEKHRLEATTSRSWIRRVGHRIAASIFPISRIQAAIQNNRQTQAALHPERVQHPPTSSVIPPELRPGAAARPVAYSRILPAPAPTSARILFNLQGDEFGKHSNLEGILAGEVLGYVTDYIKLQKSLDPSFSDSQESILNELEMASKIERGGLPEALVEAFAAKKPVLIPGGWVGLPSGHVVYYEVIPLDDGTVNFRIFNTGAGINAEHQKVQVGVKGKVSFLEWRGIPQEKLLDPHFAQIIKEMTTKTSYPNVTQPLYPKATDYTADDIYQGLKAFLRPTSIIDGLEAPLMEPQRAGTCACRALFAFLKSKMPIEEYQRLKLDLRIRALSGFISKPLEADASTEVQYHLVNKATEKLSRRVTDLFAKKVIGSETLIAAKDYLERADLWLNEHKIEKKTLSMEQGFTCPTNPLTLSQTPSLGASLTGPQGISPTQIPLSQIISQISTYSLDNPEIFTENIESLSVILKAAYANKEYGAVHFGILDIIKKIPINEFFFGEIKGTNPEIEGVMNNLATLSELFVKSCYRVQDSGPFFNGKEYALSKLLVTQKKLALRLGNNIDLVFRDNSSSPYNLQLDPVIADEMQSIRSTRTFRNDSFFSFDFDSSISNKSFFKCYIYGEKPLFIKLIKDKYPEIFQKIKEENPGFDTKNHIEQNLLMFMSPHLPSWMQSIKKSLVCQGYIQAMPIVPLEDFSISLDFQYQTKGNGYISISLEGITPQNFSRGSAKDATSSPASSTYQAPIKNPMIKDLISIIVNRFTQLEEKSLSSTSGSQLFSFNFRTKYLTPFSENGIKELAHIFTSPDHFLIEALEYFTLHPENLRDLDYQQLFQLACFNSLSSDYISCSKEQISSFLTKQISLSQNEEDVKTQVFLERMGRYFNHYDCKAPNITQHLLELLAHKKTTPEEKSLIYAELAAALSENPSLTGPQATLLLQAKAWIEHTPIPLEWKDPRTCYDMEKALCKHARALVNLILPSGRPNTQLLNGIYTLINEEPPPSDLTWEPIHSAGMSPRFKTNHNDFYDPMRGGFITVGQEAYLPLEIRDHVEFKELFPDVRKGIARSSDTFEFTHGGNKVLVRKTELGLIIEQFTEGSWLRFIPNIQLTTGNQERVSSALASRYLADKYNVWHSISDVAISASSSAASAKAAPPARTFSRKSYDANDMSFEMDDYRDDPGYAKPTKIAVAKEIAPPDQQTVVLFDKKTGIKTYEAKYSEGSITSLTRLTDGAILGKSSKLLERIEDPSYIQEWYKGGKRIEVELPRFHLSFKPGSEGRLQCIEQPGFFLSEDQNLRAIGPCKYALILKNKEGKTRVVLPNQHLEEPGVKESLEPKITRDQFLKKGDSADFSYFTYDLTSNGYLESSSQEGYFYLTQTLAAHHEYKQAAHYLRSYGEKLSSYSLSEIEALKETAKVQEVTGDKSGEQVAIALYATYLLATNKIRSPDALKALPEFYEQYLLRSRNVTALKLSKEEELHLLKSLLPEPLGAQFIARLKQLDPTYTNPVTESRIPRGDSPSGKPIELHRLTSLMGDETTQLPPNFENSVLITRSADFIKKHLVDIIKIAIQGSPKQKKWLQTASLLLKTNTQDPTNAPLGIIIEKILNNPEKFPLPPKRSDHPENVQSLGNFESFMYQQTQIWWSEIIYIAQSLETIPIPSPIRPIATSTPDRSSTPPIDQPQINIPDLPFTFTPALASPLSQEVPFATWMTEVLQPVLVNPGLTEFLASQGSSDPVESAEWTRLVEDAKALSEKPPKTIYHLNQEISEITPVLQAKESDIQRDLTALEEQMLSIAATVPTDPTARALFLLQKKGRLLQEITLDDIFISLALKDPKKILKQNPHVSQGDLNTLYTLASNYLQLASQGAQVERCIALCQKISTEPTEELRQELGEQLNAKRCYTISEDPAYLVFEYYAGVIMRKDQVDKLDAFLRGDTPNPVMEMIMGSGKSKILLPLLSLLKADGTALSMVVMPEPQFESASSDTQAIHQKAYAKSLKTLHFDRNSTFTLRSLEEIKTFLESVIEEKQCLSVISKSIPSLLLKFIEYANILKEQGITESPELKVMTSIIALLQKKANPLIDEADTVLNVLHEVSFSLGQKVAPKEEEIKLIGTLYQLLYSDPTLKHIARLESDPHPDSHAPPLTEELYLARLKEPLARALIGELIHQGKLPASAATQALAYMCRDEAKATESDKFYDAQSPALKNLLALGGEELCNFLPHTLSKPSDERYGLDKGVISIPYAAANTASHGSLFSNPHITMNYTYQIHAKNGIGEDTLIRVIQQLKKQADSQVIDEHIELTETAAYKQFCLLKGNLTIPFKHNLHPDDLTSLTARINNDPKIRQELIEKLFLPQMDLFEYKLACNPINLIALFSKVSGFTGTLWNAGSMHSKLQPQPEAGTDAKTLNLLMEKSSGPALVIPKVAGAAMFGALPPHDALIDAGGYFKEGGNLTIARKMALEMGKPVVFYNSKGVQTITDGTSETPLSASPLKEDQRLTFYDQSHTTGSDIKQKGEALGLVTIGRGMLLRDLLQSVWRLRGLEKGQRVQFVMDEEVASIIKEQLGSGAEEIGYKEILQFVIKNQAKQQGDDNFKAYKQQLDNFSQNLMLEVMTSPDYTPQQKSEAFSYLSSTWIKPANLSPAELYGKPAFKRPSGDVIQEAAEKCSSQLEAIGKQIPFLKGKIEVLKSEIPGLQRHVAHIVHSQVISSQSDTDGTVEVAQATQVATEVSTEMEAEGDNAFEKMELGSVRTDRWEHVDALSTDYITQRIPLFPIADQMSREPGLAPYQDLFNGIDISINVLEWKEGELKQIDKMRLLGAHRTPFHHLIVNGDEVTLFSQIETVTRDPNYYNLTLGFNDLSRELSPAAFEKVVKLKFLNGDSTFTKKELGFLERWFRVAGVAKMQDLYLKTILKYQTDKKGAFEGSNLERLFKKLKT